MTSPAAPTVRVSEAARDWKLTGRGMFDLEEPCGDRWVGRLAAVSTWTAVSGGTDSLCVTLKPGWYGGHGGHHDDGGEAGDAVLRHVRHRHLDAREKVAQCTRTVAPTVCGHCQERRSCRRSTAFLRGLAGYFREDTRPNVSARSERATGQDPVARLGWGWPGSEPRASAGR